MTDEQTERVAMAICNVLAVELGYAPYTDLNVWRSVSGYEKFMRQARAAIAAASPLPMDTAPPGHDVLAWDRHTKEWIALHVNDDGNLESRFWMEFPPVGGFTHWVPALPPPEEPIS